MTGFANKLNEPFSTVPTPQQGVAPTSGTSNAGTNSASNLPSASIVASAPNPSARNRTVKSSIHDLEAWLPVRRTSTDAKTSVPAVCVISASPAPEIIAVQTPESIAVQTPESIAVQTTEVPQPTREPTAPTLTDTPSIAAPSPDNEAPAMLGSGLAPVERSTNPAPTTLRCDPAPTAQTNPAAALGPSPAPVELPSPTPTLLRCDPSPAQKNPAKAAQTNSALSFLDIPPLECKTVFEKE